MVARVTGLICAGLRGIPVTVEVVVDRGLPNFIVVGLPNAAVREARERVRAAIRASGHAFPLQRITVSLSPADLPKEGTSLDLAVAVGLLVASGQCPPPPPHTAFFGELGLDGAVRPVRGALSMALAAREHGLRHLICPAGNAREAFLLPGIEPVPVALLGQVVERLAGGGRLAPSTGSPAGRPWREEGAGREEPGSPGRAGWGLPIPDLAAVRGHPHARRALEIAAAGGHHLLLLGPPGSGKTLLASCLPGLLPPLSPDEAIEVMAIHSVAGQLPAGAGLLTTPPLRAPHHSTPPAALVGGGQPPRPGEVTLAHRGVLLLDELPEFRRESLEALREPLESGWVTIARLGRAERFPAAFQLVATANPCPCGRPKGKCRCSDREVARYRQALSGPLLDRIDLQVWVDRPAVAPTALPGKSGEGSAPARARVLAARRRQAERFRRLGLALAPGLPPLNRHLEAAEAGRWAPMGAQARRYLERVYHDDTYGLSARGLVKVLRVARTVADLEGSEEITAEHLQAAVRFRPELQPWGT